MRTASNADTKITLPPVYDWRTTDADEINKRRPRAREESFAIENRIDFFNGYKPWESGAPSIYERYFKSTGD